MIPKPPFARDLSPEAEEREFQRLQEHLRTLWTSVFPRDEEHYTSVVVPSLAQSGGEGATFLEERLLFFLMRLRNPRARMVFVTSQPVHPLIVEYYLQLLSGIPASHARSRLVLLCAHDHSPRPLAQKVLERPRLLERIRRGIEDRQRAYLTVPQATMDERRLAVLLGIPMNALDPRLGFLTTPEGGLSVFEEAGVAAADPGGAEARPSVELRINPHGEASLTSTHEHDAPGDGGAPACLFPANDAYRQRLQEAGLRVGRVLAAKGVTSRFSIEFAALRSSSGWSVRAAGLRLGMGDVTHPMLALRFLTGGRLDERSGFFISPRGQAKFYRAIDAVRSDAYRGLLPEDLVEILTFNRLGFSQRYETGVLFHMIGAVSQFGSVGLVAIGNSRAEADRLVVETLAILDRETSIGR